MSPPFQRFLDDHRDVVHRFLVASVGPTDADDCLQDTLVAALRAYDRLPAEANARAWVLTIARRKAIDLHRARRRLPLPVESVPEPTGWSPAAADEGEPGLWAVVRGLPARQRAAVTLRYAADLTHGEIAAVLGCSEEAARRSLHEGLKRLRERWT